ncbi:MAG: hypothetical protein GXP08_05760 [Gammaproteobacteria bacterium]|nr:hypothetical protein [Gammaproteobacteria bacterium]
MSGIRQLARNDLTHRIVLKGRNEFTYLAKNFNQVTDDLAQQRSELLDARSELECKVVVRKSFMRPIKSCITSIRYGGTFFADISHELRTALTVIRGEAEVTLRGKDKAVLASMAPHRVSNNYC